MEVKEVLILKDIVAALDRLPIAQAANRAIVNNCQQLLTEIANRYGGIPEGEKEEEEA